MTPEKVRIATVAQKTRLIDDMLRGIESLPLESLDSFRADGRDVAAAESYVRRALEALLDLGRHVLTRGLGERTLEYKEIARALERSGVLRHDDAGVLFEMAGYRNRLTHFYDEVTTAELYDICAHRPADIVRVRDAVLDWLRRHPEKVDGDL